MRRLVASLAAVSSIATAPKVRAPRSSASTSTPTRLTSLDALAGVALAAALVALSFVTAGGADLRANTWAEIVLTALGSGAAVIVLLYSAAGRAWGAATGLLFAALLALTAFSILWSVKPDDSWLVANLTLSYLAAFAGAMALARIAPARWAAVVGGVTLAATAISLYALLSKVFPSASDAFGRISAPYDYWNAVGLLAAVGVPGCLWAGTRRELGRATRALAVPALAVQVAAIMLSYSRGALAAAIVGAAFWFVFVPLRLRGGLVLMLGTAGGAIPTVWALSTQALSHDYMPLVARTTAGHAFGVLLALLLPALTAAGLIAAFATDRVILPAARRRQVGIALIGVVALLPLGGIAALTASQRGLTGEISHVWSTFTDPNAIVKNNPDRLVQAGSTRARYWSEGLKVGEHAVLAGAGAGGFATARTRYTNTIFTDHHAHSYVIQTFADLGLLGVITSGALLIAWAMAARRAVRGDDTPERRGLLTLLAATLIFGIGSSVDWTWFIPGVTVPALICAGWLAGRGRPGSPIGTVRRRAITPGLGSTITLIAAATVLVCWLIYQPLSSYDADQAAISAMPGHPALALADARTAINRNPLAVQPKFDLAAIDQALGDEQAAKAELQSAVRVQPDNPDTWQRLGSFYLHANRPRAALIVLQRASVLYQGSPAISSAIDCARQELRGATNCATAAP